MSSKKRRRSSGCQYKDAKNRRLLQDSAKGCANIATLFRTASTQQPPSTEQPPSTQRPPSTEQPPSTQQPPSTEQPPSTQQPSSKSYLSSSHVSNPLDIAEYTKPGEISDVEKQFCLKNKWKPPNHFNFPKDVNKRSYRSEWENIFNWLRYSPSTNGAYCVNCVLFPSANAKNELTRMPFTDWKNAVGANRGRLNRHATSENHKMSLMRTENFIKVISQSKPSICASISRAYNDKINQNRKALCAIIDAIHFLSLAGVGLRGNWNDDLGRETGNFYLCLEKMRKYSIPLNTHLNTAPNNAKYLSPKIQNQLIGTMGDMVRDHLVNKCNLSTFISICADETTDAGTIEQMAVCVRYFDSEEGSINEDFLGYVALKETSAETITRSMIDTLKKWGVNLDKWRGKGFDGASNMSGSINGGQARITKEYPHARYFTHCSNHCLNLVITASCQNVIDIRNFMNSFMKMSFFLVGSAKRKAILQEKMSDKGFRDLIGELDADIDNETALFSECTKKLSLPTLCTTRWLSRVDSISTLLVHFDQIHDALHAIKNQSQSQSSSDAYSHILHMEQFPFIVAASISQYILAFLRPLSVSLQSKSCDLVEAHEDAQTLISTLQTVREEEEKYNKVYMRAVNVANSINVQPSKPRTGSGKKQQHRANAETSISEDPIACYFKNNFYLPFIDHVLSHLRTRFPNTLKDVMLAMYLIPSKLHHLQETTEMRIKSEFENDLPFPDSFEQEIMRWRHYWSNQEDKQSTLHGALQHCNQQFYPNIRTILELLITLPVGSCSCERSFSSLRRLKTWSRTSTLEDRLNSLALIYIHGSTPFVRDLQPIDVLKKWDSTMSGRISLAFDK